MDIVNVMYFVAGGLFSLFIQHLYYHMSRKDSKTDRVAHRLDGLSVDEKIFLVAMLQHDSSLPLYALLTWSGKTKGGQAIGPVNSNGITMFKTFRRCKPAFASSQVVGKPSPHEITFELTATGTESAQYLAQNEVDSASFGNINLDYAEQLYKQFGFPPR